MEMAIEKRKNNGSISERTGKDPKSGKFLPGNTFSEGKPKGTKHFSTLLMNLMREEIEVFNKDKKKGVKMTIDRAMSLAIAKKAMEGDVPAFNAITNRTDGLPMQSVEMEISTPPVPIYSGKSLNVKAKEINGKRRGKKI